MTPAHPALAFLVDIMNELDDDIRLGVASRNIEAVEAWWVQNDADATSAGFVVQLLDARRAYLQMVDDHEAGEDELDVEVDILGEDQAIPAGVPSGWSTDVAALNAWLRSVKAS